MRPEMEPQPLVWIDIQPGCVVVGDDGEPLELPDAAITLDEAIARGLVKVKLPTETRRALNGQIWHSVWVVESHDGEDSLIESIHMTPEGAKANIAGRQWEDREDGSFFSGGVGKYGVDLKITPHELRG